MASYESEIVQELQELAKHNVGKAEQALKGLHFGVFDDLMKDVEDGVAGISETCRLMMELS